MENIRAVDRQMQAQSRFNSRKVKENIWDRGLRLKQWAELNGFRYGTFRKVIDGAYGMCGQGIKSRAILKALRDQGLLEEAEEGQERKSA